MENDKKVNRKATIQAILDKCNSGVGWDINIHEFNKKVAEKGDEFIIDSASFCQVEVIYEK